MPLHMGKRDLQHRRDQLLGSATRIDAAGLDSATVSLLLLHTAECALSERLLTRGKHRDSSALEPHHDLRSMAQELRLPGIVGKHIARLHGRRAADPAVGRIDRSDLCTALRLGVELDEADQKAVQDALRAIIDWCMRN
ncbi:hypothetical protein ACFP1Z_16220 [Streptomyces gamaensis]|uniref:HEPN domain-containing protein n=1 Tax=Streptomyces gamaensis TaxID=1763542 RepID=A0ABW0Z3S0_9ACTN